MSTDPDYIKRMDDVAEKLLDQVEDEKTSETQKGRLFAQVMAWYKLRAKLVPSGEGEGLKEMSNAIQSQSGGRSGSAGAAKGGTADAKGGGSKDGKAIREIIRSLPAYGGRARGDKADPEREDRGAASDGGSVPADGGGDVGGDVAGARRSA